MTTREVISMMTKQQKDGRIDLPDVTVSVRSDVAPERIYAALADLSSHTTWAGSMHGKKQFGLRSIQPSANPAVVGSEFDSSGDDPMGRFTDHSVVTEATGPSVFEFVTEGHLDPKKRAAASSDTRITNRYEIRPDGTGSVVTYRLHVSKWTNASAALRSRALRPLARLVFKRYATKLLRNLTTYAAEH
jgi:hypothetical protein